MAPMKKCPSCGGALVASRKRQTQSVGGREFVMTVAAGACRSCGSVFLEDTSLQRAEMEIACELARHGPVSGEAFRHLRKTLGLRALVVADLLGVTPETISRWENGQRPVDKAAWLTLGSVVLEQASRRPETLERLRELRAHGPGARSIRIDVSRDEQSSSSAKAQPRDRVTSKR
jgi:putative zinc finger/helix-turn-helix YgiT family protein